MKDDVIIYTDGGCSGNPGPGGWGLVVIADEQEKQLSGGEDYTTNNRMELTAAISALTIIKNTPEFAGRKIAVYIDSQYVKGGITDWIETWKVRNWKTSDRTPVKNQDLWMQLDALNKELKVKWNWVKGHSGNKYNEICDALCKKEMEKRTNKEK